MYSYEGIMVDIADEMAKQMNATYNMIALDIGYSSDPVLGIDNQFVLLWQSDNKKYVAVYSAPAKWG